MTGLLAIPRGWRVLLDTAGFLLGCTFAAVSDFRYLIVAGAATAAVCASSFVAEVLVWRHDRDPDATVIPVQHVAVGDRVWVGSLPKWAVVTDRWRTSGGYQVELENRETHVRWTLHHGHDVPVRVVRGESP